ncbi:UDP-N-acetylmuramoyl-tripeptide--D-alanyl-D-alanine ligase [Antarcticimicrobium sediminis]|uniref:UDP-N-acetylmuramoyl-tripeptide--D-alanyl-D-alanine ligase n=1 Tax=Antarcticimicrobium sediminis TaxID=2546227 RepID=A0A4R5F128_9RHOB|nr:UDP-N-acetylmuramoyl-tripeptide--D-alanyl-D-alanine ligase [Antarcticimicrobium sediminis]TDE41083.1 UDP-N-acetylmuramoyl-tripeptide--D-alanyl-D-alanine ligase [Antarcticimicrobium sediminis]
MTLWTAPEAEAATGGRAQGDWAVSGVSIDTRTLAPGDLFVALSAARDGHDFVAQALEKGAGAALVSRIPEGLAPDAPLLIVADVLKGLEALGRAARARTSARVVAVTGSVGKTSTKEMLAAMLSEQGATHASVASYNNHWGVPLTLARMPRESDFAIIEIGMNHPGEIAPLACLARPHVAMITTVAPAHLEAFDSIAGIAREKAAILDGVEPGGIAVLNADLEQSPILFAKAAECGAQAVGFGAKAKEYRLISAEITGDETRVQAETPLGPMAFSLATPGQHFAMNGLGALAACAALGADLQRAADSLARWTPYQGRGARERIALPGGTLTLLDDSYNANPASMAAALAVLAAARPEGQGRRIAVLGDMKELGPETEPLHAALARLPAMAAVDRVHCIGPLMGALHAALPVEKRGLLSASSAELAAQLAEVVGAGDVVLAKGSLSMGLAKCVDALRGMGQGNALSRDKT